MKTKVILIVEDEAVVRAVTVRLLQFYGFEKVLQAENLRQGREMITEHNPDLVICDLIMSDGRGDELVKWINNEFKKERPKVKTIILSGGALNISEDAEEIAVAAGADKFLHKPVDPQELKNEIEELLKE